VITFFLTWTYLLGESKVDDPVKRVRGSSEKKGSGSSSVPDFLSFLTRSLYLLPASQEKKGKIPRQGGGGGGGGGGWAKWKPREGGERKTGRSYRADGDRRREPAGKRAGGNYLPGKKGGDCVMPTPRASFMASVLVKGATELID